jgi:putative alpha-1,2-mannosidase
MLIEKIKKIFFFLFFVPLIVDAQEKASKDDLAKWVNPLIGTQSEFKLSNSNTYPAIVLPGGMNFWTPYTGKMGDG